jgi:hypothetical protein
MKELITDCHGAGEAPGDHDHHEHQFAVAAKEQTTRHHCTTASRFRCAIEEVQDLLDHKLITTTHIYDKRRRNREEFRKP